MLNCSLQWSCLGAAGAPGKWQLGCLSGFIRTGSAGPTQFSTTHTPPTHPYTHQLKKQGTMRILDGVSDS